MVKIDARIADSGPHSSQFVAVYSASFERIGFFRPFQNHELASVTTVGDNKVFCLSKNGHIGLFDAMTGAIQVSSSIGESRLRLGSWHLSRHELIVLYGTDQLLFLNADTLDQVAKYQSIGWRGNSGQLGTERPVPIGDRKKVSKLKYLSFGLPLVEGALAMTKSPVAETATGRIICNISNAEWSVGNPPARRDEVSGPTNHYLAHLDPTSGKVKRSLYTRSGPHEARSPRSGFAVLSPSGKHVLAVNWPAHSNALAQLRDKGLKILMHDGMSKHRDLKADGELRHPGRVTLWNADKLLCIERHTIGWFYPMAHRPALTPTSNEMPDIMCSLLLPRRVAWEEDERAFWIVTDGGLVRRIDRSGPDGPFIKFDDLCDPNRKHHSREILIESRFITARSKKAGLEPEDYLNSGEPEIADSFLSDPFCRERWSVVKNEGQYVVSKAGAEAFALPIKFETLSSPEQTVITNGLISGTQRNQFEFPIASLGHPVNITDWSAEAVRKALVTLTQEIIDKGKDLLFGSQASFELTFLAPDRTLTEKEFYPAVESEGWDIIKELTAMLSAAADAGILNAKGPELPGEQDFSIALACGLQYLVRKMPDASAVYRQALIFTDGSHESSVFYLVYECVEKHGYATEQAVRLSLFWLFYTYLRGVNPVNIQKLKKTDLMQSVRKRWDPTTFADVIIVEAEAVLKIVRWENDLKQQLARISQDLFLGREGDFAERVVKSLESKLNH